MRIWLRSLRDRLIAAWRHIQGPPDKRPWLNISGTQTAALIQQSLGTRCPVWWLFEREKLVWWCRREDGVECGYVQKIRIRRPSLKK